MAKIMIVESYRVNRANRLDANYYKNTFIDFESKLTTMKCKKLDSLATSISKGLTPTSPKNYTKAGVPFLRVLNIQSPFINLEKAVFISKERSDQHLISMTRESDIIISITGTIGNVGIITSDLGDCGINQNLVAIVVNKKKINPFFLVVFLMTKYGQYQFEREKTGRSIFHFSVKAIKNVLVPIFDQNFQKMIETKVLNSYQKIKGAKDIYFAAEKCLLDLLGFKERSNAEKQYFSISLAETRDNYRLDPIFYKSIRETTDNTFDTSGYPTNQFNNLVDVIRESIEPKKVAIYDNKFRYVPISVLSEDGVVTNWDELYFWDAPSRARMLIKENDILIPMVANSFKKVSLVPKELNNQLTTTGCYVIRSENYTPEFLFLLLRSKPFIAQLNRFASGTVYDAINLSNLSEIRLPDIPFDDQAEITKMIEEYFRLKREYRLLIDEIIETIETKIEMTESQKN